jgi:DNA-binding IclR family transcriptional regulator
LPVSEPLHTAAIAPAVTSNGPVGAVTNAVRILDHLASSQGPLRLTQISRPLGINTSTCLNILRTLVAEGLVRADGAAKTYGLGRRLVELAREALNHGENLGTLRPAMDSLALKYGVTLMLWGRLDADNLILLAASVGEPMRSIHVELGLRVPLLTGSMGRLFAADLGETELRKRFDAVAWQKPLPFEAYLSQVEEAGERGWALDAGYLNTAIWGISAPVAHRGAPIDRTINAALLADQRDPDAIDRIAHDLVLLGQL